MLPLAEASRRIERARIVRVAETWVSPFDAVGLASARTLKARRDEPSEDRAAMDGFAVRFRPGSANRAFRLRPGLVTPAARASPLALGEGVAIATGGRLPPGADAVVRKEWARASGTEIRLRRDVRAGSDVHERGEDLERGTVILRAGEAIRPFHAALFTAQRIERVGVRRPRVVLVPIGDELVPGRHGSGDRTPDTISPLIERLTPGPIYSRLPAVRDRADALRRTLARASRGADLIVTIGGTSVGERDITKPVVAALGRLEVPGVRVNVLKRGGFGLIGRVPVVLLPGQVISAVTTWCEHGLRVLARLTGASPPGPFSARLTRPIANSHRMDSVYLFRVSEGSAEPLRWGVRLFSELARANAYGIVPHGARWSKGSQLSLAWLGPRS